MPEQLAAILRTRSVVTIWGHEALEKAASRIGITALRGWQRDALDAWAAGRDCMILAGTGSGKSACFQIPPLLDSGAPALVVSPLISLMRDQVKALTDKGVRACFLGSAQPDAQVERAALAGDFELIYVCPETLMRLLPGLRRLRLSVCAIDEAHCIAAWGHDFRPDYAKLRTLKQEFPGTPLMALTATATLDVRAQIAHSLGLAPSHCCVVQSFHRPNLAFSVVHSRTARRCWEEDLGFLVGSDDDSGEFVDLGIVYAPSRKEVEGLAEWLCAKGVLAAPYHARLPKAQLEATHVQWNAGRIEVIVATIAFGMGIDRSNVRRVIHYGWPQSLEALYQEAGRAGRDGLPSECVPIANLARMPSLLPNAARTAERTAACQRMLLSLHSYATASSGCRQRDLIGYFGESKGAEWRCGQCDLCKRAAPELGVVDVESDSRILMAAVQEIWTFANSQFDDFQVVCNALGGRARPRHLGRVLEGLACWTTGRHRRPVFWTALGSFLARSGLLVSSAVLPADGWRSRTPAMVRGARLTELGAQALHTLAMGHAVPVLRACTPSADLALALQLPPVGARIGGGSPWANQEWRKQRLAKSG
jgi:ATP-dependent DNA helicase RecQ